MATFEEILRDTHMTDALNDAPWMEKMALFLNSLSDPYLVEALRFAVMASAIRLAGDNPSSEGARHAVDKVIELLRESTNVRS